MKGYPTKYFIIFQITVILENELCFSVWTDNFLLSKIFSFFRKIKIERNTKLKLIAYIRGITYYKMSLIEAPNAAFHKAKKKRAVEGGRIIFRLTV